MAIEKNAKGLYETDIDGITYEFSVWRAKRAMRTLIELSSIAGGFLAKSAGLFNKPNALQSEVDPAVLSGIAESLIDGLNRDAAKSMTLIERLTTEGVSRDGKQVDFDTAFERNFAHMFKVIKAALEVQYGNFSDVGKMLRESPPRPSN